MELRSIVGEFGIEIQNKKPFKCRKRRAGLAEARIQSSGEL